MGAAHAAPTVQPLAEPPRARLTDHELVLLQLLSRGYSLAQCAQLGGTTGTEALADAQRAAAKLGMRNSTAAVFEAHRLGLIV